MAITYKTNPDSGAHAKLNFYFENLGVSLIFQSMLRNQGNPV